LGLTVQKLAHGASWFAGMPFIICGYSREHPMALSFPSKAHHLAALYDACALILDTYKETDIFKVYSDEGLEDHIDFAATAREIMGLIAEGDIK